MNELFNTVLTNVSSDITIYSALITIFSSLILGIIITFTYYLTCDEIMYQKSFAITLLMLPIILSVIILFIGSKSFQSGRYTVHHSFPKRARRPKGYCFYFLCNSCRSCLRSGIFWIWVTVCNNIMYSNNYIK